jgi:hypothetical protein
MMLNNNRCKIDNSLSSRIMLKPADEVGQNLMEHLIFCCALLYNCY